MMKKNIASSIIVVGLLLGPHAMAQGSPQGLLEADKATEGKTDVAKTGFEAAERLDAQSKDTTQFKISAGGLFSSGNARATSLTGLGDFKLRRGDNQFVAKAAFNYARSAASVDAPMETTLENMQGRLRYDRFFSNTLAGFVGVSALRDRFLGLDLRLNVDPGLAVYFIDQKGHQLWSEIGYDLQHDVRRDETIEAAAEDGQQVDKSETRHSGRLFVGYENALNESVSLNTGLEYLQGFQNTDNYRLNWNAGLTSSIGGNFAIATTVAVRYDHNPLPDVKTTDVITAVSVVYTLL